MKHLTFTAALLAALAILLIGSITLTGCAATQSDEKTVFIAGSFGALSRSVYDGEITLGELKRHGDFMLGTTNGIDGELIGLDGKYYQIGAQGKINPADDSWKTPWASATFLKVDKVVTVDKELTWEQLKEYLNSQLPTQNIFYAMKISGTFSYLKARTLTKLNRPYPTTPYATISQNEPTFEFNNVESTLVTFFSPSCTGDLNYPGYHAHFLNSGNNYGGHVLDCRIARGSVEIGYVPNLTVNLPQNSEYFKLDFSKPK
ncbi:MAG: acetolactate decarboxylase [Dehalococcoidia bacterium]|nr:acetolactate decarboxylase [Dehalococcoidia bacterium]MDD5494392.1 acetolactate decarboxylase [Dehalococcoidia bacterium]